MRGVFDMQDERHRILDMVEKGSITAEQAVLLLEALKNNQGDTQTVHSFNEADSITENVQNPSDFSRIFENKAQQFAKDFENKFQTQFGDFRQDLSQLGTLFMDVLNNTVNRAKDFEMKPPFPEKYDFTHIPVLADTPVEQLDIEVSNGGVTIIPIEQGATTVSFNIKTAIVANNVEEARANVLDKLLVQNDRGKLTIYSDMKLAQVHTTVSVPKKDLTAVVIRLLNGEVDLHDVTMQKLAVRTLNGEVQGLNLSFNRAKIETSNGSIVLRNVTGKEMEAETMNGRIYVDGALDDVEAKSINGPVVVTTTSESTSKIDAQTVAGSVEVYVPRNISLSGKAVTNFGKLDLGITDATKVDYNEQFLAKTVRFEKEVENASKLWIDCESKTGSVLVKYAGISSEVE